MSVADVPVAQLDRALDSDSKGRAFESHRAYQKRKARFARLSFFIRLSNDEDFPAKGPVFSSAGGRVIILLYKDLTSRKFDGGFAR